MRTLTILKRARRLIARGWTQGANARDRYGATTLVYSPTNPPIAFCINGAIYQVLKLPCDMTAPFDAMRSALRGKYKELGLIRYNDAKGRTQKQVLALFDRAIAKLEEKPK